MNLIFDLGGVVVEWQPQAICAQAFADPVQQATALEHIIGHPDWLELDRGTLARDEAIRRAAARTGWEPAPVQAFFDGVPAALQLKPDTVDLMRRLHAAGHRLFCLSNMPHHSLAYLEQAYTFWDVFSARVISCQVGMCKPEPGMYAHLLQHCAIESAQSVFIDDIQANVDAAAAFGIHPLRFENAAQCEVALASWFATQAARA
jgi:putative hydrolase of the HAD superfamily